PDEQNQACAALGYLIKRGLGSLPEVAIQTAATFEVRRPGALGRKKGALRGDHCGDGRNPATPQVRDKAQQGTLTGHVVQSGGCGQRKRIILERWFCVDEH